MLRQISLKNVLSYKNLPDFELRSLNVLIGANGSGKSNFLEVLGLLRAAPRDLASALRQGGGLEEWRWKGLPRGPVYIRTTFDDPGGPLRYTLVLREDAKIEERLTRPDESDPNEFHTYFSARISQRGSRLLLGEKSLRRLKPEDLDPEQSLLSQIRDPGRYPEITRVARLLDRICLYREWTMGASSASRRAPAVDLAQDMLREDVLNLPLVLHRLQTDNHARSIETYLAKLLPDFRRLVIRIEGSRARLFLDEGPHEELTPASRLSDGTLRFLFLMTVLCDPSPPPLVGIDEPELGLHPEAVQLVAQALKQAASRTQLVVTTHSEALVDELSDVPESVVICEREPDGSSQLRRLSRSKLKLWLADYRLGELWRKGEIGGTLW